MTKERASTVAANIGGGLLFATAGIHVSAYSTIVAQTPADARSLMAAAWVAIGVSLIIAGLLAVAVSPLFIVRRRALLVIAALTPFSIAVFQVVYLGFLPPTALLLLDALVLVIAGQLGHEYQPRPIRV